MTMNEATRRQVEATHPERSTWLSANAGSGKTRVLTDRVARLLLSGVDPQNILCLTYTKAAASEMQNRLFKRLGSWSMLEDDRLGAELEAIGAGGETGKDALARARRLFALAIETPGGLKIQTIHSFCSALLRRFPLEAGVSPQFKEVDERAAELLMTEVLDGLAEGPEADLLDGLAGYITDEDGVIKLLYALLRNRASFRAGTTRADVFTAFELGPDESLDALAARTLGPDAEDIIADLIATLPRFNKTDATAAETLAAIPALDETCLPALEKLLLYGEKAKSPFGPKIDAFPGKAAREALGETQSALNALMERVHLAREPRLALAAAERTWALHRFATAFLARYEAAKLARGWLDFDDLILKARGLLTDPKLAQWVLYRLDGGIDHILVDEAQDTSPFQWDVVERLTEEFTSGIGARADTLRTLFVVGDVKQSIYSFQGADPKAFGAMRDAFRRRFAEVAHPFQESELRHSFRSAPAILDVVDKTFALQGGEGLGQVSDHVAFQERLPGRVDLWPVVPKPEKREPGDWYEPVDQPADNDAEVILARKIAREIRRITDPGAGETLPESGRDGALTRRPVRPGDVLVLVQRRSPLFHEIIRACKTEGLAIAGADRLRVGAELAVKDLAALLGFLDLPEDDLALATALRSPLFGWSEQALFDLAARRGKAFLWEALRGRAQEFSETVAVLDALRRDADYLRPYDLIERILTRHDGRRRLLARLGREAEDGIDALLGQALAYEQTEVPSLTGFLVWMQTDDLEIKRQMDSASDQIRVMTVHGAKGLEAPIVILPDTAKRKPPTLDPLLDLDGIPAWRPRAGEAPPALKARADDARSRAEDERQRLLYVAMTRAEKWLIVAAAGETGDAGQSWYGQVEQAMQALGTTPLVATGATVQRYQSGEWAAPPLVSPQTATTLAPELPDWIKARAASPERAAPTLSPSDLGGAKALAGEAGAAEADALARGTLIHLLLEHLPALPAQGRRAAAHRLAGLQAPEAAAAVVDEAIAVSERVLAAPDLSPLFAPSALTEAPITATLPALGNARIHGSIDRLVLDGGRILAVDFKTNRVVPDSARTCPEGLLRQMGAYLHALTAIYPGRDIDVAILWTETATLMQLPHDLVTEALGRAGAP
ncbi:double-strand break repair helicase AddA [Poseidonocella sedimentorum]|uniref:DNA 3'-5' helicase n=1 Tax=Poseidonocella sedimentorum TaxID=871652 RepID=A0A1I6D6T6_9RHOB|nr:double-strand break repair helicase AddA [Poseidonocella sedimentorum]SFR01186.1 DNA helicase/exodeoxyribonuclease V, subunit A [Poseidonocella sedimentorum]